MLLDIVVNESMQLQSNAVKNLSMCGKDDEEETTARDVESMSV